MTKRLFFRIILTTPNFFYVFAKHLDEIFPNGWIYNPEKMNDDIICAVDNTAGWQKALFDTCIELNIYNIYKYWANLDWTESDILDGELSELLCAMVYDEDNQRIVYEETV